MSSILKVDTIQDQNGNLIISKDSGGGGFEGTYFSSSSPKVFTVKVITKTAASPYHNVGSNNGYSINAIEISSASEFISTLRTYNIGETVSIGLLREVKGNLEQLYIETTLIEHVEYEGEPMVGFLATTVNERFDFPFEVDIKTGNVGGPSAGLMMALNVYNNLIPEDITNSMIIAGTGTIEIDGSVGPVGGIKQKIIAAKRAGAELIIVPVANFEEAKVFETDKTAIVEVDSFAEALSVISQYSSR